jgi:hypothetical protein
MIYENENGKDSQKMSDQNIFDMRRHTNISLNGLLKTYLNIDNTIKDEIRTLMQKDVYIWYKVPSLLN